MARTGTDVDPTSDVELVRAVRRGSDDALAALYDRHARVVFAAAMRASNDRSIAAEVVQDTFLALWDRAEVFEEARGALAAWLMRIARNRAIDRLRAAARHDRARSFSTFGGATPPDRTIGDWLMASGKLIAASGPEVAPEVALTNKETRESMEQALASLVAPERQVIALAYTGGLTQSEIATSLGWPIGTVKTRTRRALRHLRNHLEAAGPGRHDEPAAIQHAKGGSAAVGVGPASSRRAKRAVWPTTISSGCTRTVVAPC